MKVKATRAGKIPAMAELETADGSNNANPKTKGDVLNQII